MIVKELIKLLQSRDGDSDVFLSRDPEGNKLFPLDEIGSYECQNGEIVREEDEEDSDWNPNAVILWPR